MTSEIDLSESGSMWNAFIKEWGAGEFLAKSARPLRPLVQMLAIKILISNVKHALFL
jgi:hypothetical protein